MLRGLIRTVRRLVDSVLLTYFNDVTYFYCTINIEKQIKMIHLEFSAVNVKKPHVIDILRASLCMMSLITDVLIVYLRLEYVYVAHVPRTCCFSAFSFIL